MTVDEESNKRRAEAKTARQMIGPQDFVYLTNNANCWIIRASEISMIEADGNYVRITLKDGTTLIERLKIGKCEEKLDSKTFFRISRQWIVNLEHIKTTYRADAKRLGVIMINGKDVTLSRSQSIFLRRKLGL